MYNITLINTSTALMLSVPPPNAAINPFEDNLLMQKMAAKA